MEHQIKSIVAKNLTELRKCKNLTQNELADLLNYSDKSISKWETGDSLPDISVLATVAELYGVTLDDLIREGAVNKIREDTAQKKKAEQYNQAIIVALSVTVVFLIASLLFVYMKLKANNVFWQAFVWAIPASCMLLLYHNRKMNGGKKLQAIILSVLFWSLLVCIYLQFLQYQLWLIFLLGVPIEIIIWLSSKLNK